MRIEARSRALCCALAGLLATSGIAAASTQTVWVADSNSVLGWVNSTTGVPTMVGPLGTTLSDLAIDGSGNMWGVGGLGLQWLYSVNPLTGAATPIGDMGAPINSLVFASDGTLYGAYNALVKINTATAALTLVGGLGFQASGDIAFNGGALYMSAVDPGGFGSDVLVRVNTTTGAGTLIGPFGATNMWGLGTGTDGVLYGGVGNHIVTISTLTGDRKR